MKEPEKTENMFWIHIKKCLCECEYVYTFFNLNGGKNEKTDPYIIHGDCLLQSW